MLSTMSFPFSLKLLSDKFFPDIPSASGIAYTGGTYYVIGDDAARVFCLDTQWNIVSTITLTDFEGYRIPKPDKADWEAATLVDIKGVRYLLALGSGSKSPQRDLAAIINLTVQPLAAELKQTGTFYGRLRSEGLAALNIEACAAIDNRLLLANRGHLAHAYNTLLLCDHAEIWAGDAHARQIALLLPQAIGTFNGISGLAYDPRTDRLFFTTSAEATSSTYDDGEIGESMLGVVLNAGQRLKEKTIVPDHLVHLSSVSALFYQQKIESVCLVSDGEDETIVLAADNDNGSSHLFKLKIVDQ
ncbi:DUF6929 family protein [Chitinophaga defluvii]|uniref:Sugar lactone lactonase YvrE n=1 Tax=Chitinophaga defluvii TaxID=3163343 RepID=A0ABV2T2W8_9BACT